MAGLGVTTTLSSSLGLFLQSMARKWLSTDNSVSPEREGGGRVRGGGGGGVGREGRGEEGRRWGGKRYVLYSIHNHIHPKRQSPVGD